MKTNTDSHINPPVVRTVPVRSRSGRRHAAAGILRRIRRRGALTLVAAAMLAMSCPGVAMGQTGILVSNNSQSSDTGISLNVFDLIQDFTTGGTAANGFGLAGVGIRFSSVYDPTLIPEVSIWTAGTGTAFLGKKLGTLTGPTRLVRGAVNIWTATGIDLLPNTRYMVLIDSTRTVNNHIVGNAVYRTSSDAEDWPRAAGWSIGNQSHHRNRVSIVNSWQSMTPSLQISIFGKVATGPGAPLLSAIAGNGQVMLSWSAPVDNGGVAVMKYQYRYWTGGTEATANWIDVPDGDLDGNLSDERGVTVTGLANGTAYIFGVRGVNRAGNGAVAMAGATPRGEGPWLTVSDAMAPEGAMLAFRVTVDRRQHTGLTVDYGTRDGTAVAREDYRPTSGTLAFGPGESEKTVEVAVLEDSHDDDGETMTLRLSNASGGEIADGEGAGVIRNTGAIPKAWIGRFGRTVAAQVLDAMESRMGAVRTPGVELSLAGERIGRRPDADPGLPGSPSEAGGADETGIAVWERMAADGSAMNFGSRDLTQRELLLGSSFDLTKPAAVPGSGVGTVSVWGRGAVSDFEGRVGDLRMDGEVKSALLGADWSRGRILTGLILGHSSGEGGYHGPTGPGIITSTLTGMYPWGRYAPTGRIEVWGAAGYGEGTLMVMPHGQDPIHTDLDLWMTATGLRGVLVDGGAEGFTLAVKTDAMAVETSSDRAPGLGASEAGVTRLRLGLEGKVPIPFDGGPVLTPGMEIGLRHDGGDAETGLGAEAGVSLTWSDTERGISAELRGRGLLTQDADGFRAWGLSGSLGWTPAKGGRGPSFTLEQTFGGALSEGTDALFQRGTLQGLGVIDGPGSGLGGYRVDPGSRRLKTRFGYGFAAFDGRFTFTPETSVVLTDTGRYYSLGWRLVRAGRGPGISSTPLALSFGLTRHESPTGYGVPPEHAVEMRLVSRF